MSRDGRLWVRRRITIVAARAVVMLGLGTGGLVRELFIVQTPDLVRVWVCLGLMLGPAVIESWWRARNPMPSPESSPSSASPGQPPS